MEQGTDSRAVLQRRAKTAGAGVGRPRKLNAEAILQAALEIIDELGADKLSMRSLASRLQVQANAVYTHFDNLEAINEALIEKLLERVPVPDAASKTPLREQLIDYFVALRSNLMLHPRVTTGRVGSPAWVRNAQHLDCVLAQLAARNVDMAVAEVAANALMGIALMSATQANAYRNENATSNLRKAQAVVKELKAPHLVAMMNLPNVKLAPDQRIRYLLGAVIDGLLPASVAKGGKGIKGVGARS